jgi:UDP-N-acetylmuramoyl-tripeptide--D-alanyl-D-alanine ligase
VNPEIKIKVNETLINSSLFGNHNVENIMAAVAIGKYFKIDLEKIKTGIEAYIPSNNRSQIITKGSNKIMLDAYNANPSSMYAAIKFFEEFSEKNKILILGDMFELGKDSNTYHQEIAEYCRNIKNTKIFLVGEIFCNTTRFKEFNYSLNIENLISKGDLSKIKNSNLFIKGSRGIKLEKVIDNLT